MTNLLRTGWWAARLLAGCSAIWIIGGVRDEGAIAWGPIATLWMVGWPMLFAGFFVCAALDLPGRELAELPVIEPPVAPRRRSR